LAALLQVLVADLEWSSWDSADRRSYLLGGLAAAAIAWGCIVLLAAIVREAITLARDDPEPAPRHPTTSPVRIASLRFLGVLPFWGLRYLAQGSISAPPQPLTILLDVALFAGHFWSIAPLFEHRRDFPTRTHWTFHFWTGFILACFTLGRDLAYFWEGVPL